MLPWTAIPLMIPPCKPATYVSLRKLRLQPDCTEKVPIVLESVKLAYRYWLFIARPIPLEVPPSFLDPLALPPTFSVLTTIPTTSPVVASEEETQPWLPLIALI